MEDRQRRVLTRKGGRLSGAGVDEELPRRRLRRWSAPGHRDAAAAWGIPEPLEILQRKLSRVLNFQWKMR